MLGILVALALGQQLVGLQDQKTGTRATYTDGGSGHFALDVYVLSPAAGGGGAISQGASRDGGTDWPVEAKVTNFPATQAVSVASLPLPAGAATEATLATRTKPADQQHTIIDSSAIIATTSSNLDVALSTRTKPSDQQHVLLDAASNVIGHVIVDSAPSTAVTGPLTDTQLRNSAVAVSLASAPTTAVTNAGLTNLDVLLSSRTKPADQQHTIIDSSASIGVTGPLTDTQLRASAVPVSLATAPALVASSAVIGHVIVDTAPTTAVTLATAPALVTSSAVIGHVIVDTAPTTAVTLAVAPSTPVTGDFWQTTQPVSVASVPVNPYPLNPFLPRCNPVRRTGCQP